MLMIFRIKMLLPYDDISSLGLFAAHLTTITMSM